MSYNKPQLFYYRIAQIAAWFVAVFIFKRKIVRNEMKGKKGSFVVIANHQAALDFVNLIGLNRRPMSFVISNSFFNTLPIKGFLRKMGVIPKQQFQTTVDDMRKMKAVIERGEPLVIYPAGLMCEDGLSTPIPSATYKFLKWLKCDVYVAKTSGTYFAMPKWSTGFRPGRTYLDVYKLFSKEEIADMDLESVKEKTDAALLFDAYREQETYQVKYKNGNNIEGLHNVLYMCPHCEKEFSMQVKDKQIIYCEECGFAQKSDVYAFLHNQGIGEEIRYVSDWSRYIYKELKGKILRGIEKEMIAKTKIYMIDFNKNIFKEVGEGIISLTKDQFRIMGKIMEKETEIVVSITQIPTLPFSPGKYLEIQQGETIYRCAPEDGRLVMKFINMVKIFYEINMDTNQRVAPKNVKSV